MRRVEKQWSTTIISGISIYDDLSEIQRDYTDEQIVEIVNAYQIREQIAEKRYDLRSIAYDQA